MINLTQPVPFLYVVLVVLAICATIALGIFFVNLRTKKLKMKELKNEEGEK